MDHHVFDFEIPEINQAADHVAGFAFHAAFVMQQGDGAAQFIAGGEDGLVLADADAKRPQDQFDHPFNRHGQGAKQGNRP